MQKPVDTLARLRDKHVAWRGTSVATLNRVLQAEHYETFELRATVEPAGANAIGWKVLSGNGAFTEVGYDGSRGELFVDRTYSGVTKFSRDFPARTVAPLAAGNSALSLTILVDRSTIEVFAQRGRVAMTNLVYPPAGAKGIEFYARDTVPRRIMVDLWSLRSTWMQPD